MVRFLILSHYIHYQHTYIQLRRLSAVNRLIRDIPTICTVKSVGLLSYDQNVSCIVGHSEERLMTSFDAYQQIINYRALRDAAGLYWTCTQLTYDVQSR